MVTTKLLRSLLFGLMMVNFTTLWAAQSISGQRDSLERLLTQALPDTQQVNIMNRLGKILLNTDPAAAFQYARQANSQADGIGFAPGKAQSAHIMGQYYCSYKNDFAKASHHFRSAISLLETLNRPHLQVRSIVWLGYCYEILGDYPTATVNYESALEIYTTLGDYNAISGLLNNLGNTAWSKGEYEASIGYFIRALNICDTLKDTNYRCMVLGNLGAVYVYQGNYTRAMAVFLEAMALAEKDGYHQQYAEAATSLGSIYLKTGVLGKSLERYEDALNIRLKFSDKKSIAESLSNIGLYYLEAKELNLALEYFYQALDTAKGTNASKTLTIIHINIGAVLSEKGQYVKAMEHFERAKKQADQMKSKYYSSSTLRHMGTTYIATGQYRKAEKKLVEGMEQAKEIGAITQLQDFYYSLYKVYRQLKDFEQASKFLSEYVEITDSIVNLEKSKQLVAMEAKYEHEKNLRRIDSLNADTAILARLNKNQKLEISQGNLWKWSLISVVIIILMALILLYLVSRQNKIRSREKNLLLQQKLLRTQMNPHFIFNFLSSIQGVIYKNDPEKAADYISDFANLVRMYLENSRHEFIPLDKEISGLKYYLKLKQELLNKDFTYHFHIDNEIQEKNLEIPPMLAQPFIENALEHGIDKPRNEIHIWFRLDDDQLRFEVTDNGMGILKSLSGKKDDPRHQSLAITITEERLSLLNQGKKKKIKLEIEDLSNRQNTTGTKVSFNIPYLAA